MKILAIIIFILDVFLEGIEFVLDIALTPLLIIRILPRKMKSRSSWLFRASEKKKMEILSKIRVEVTCLHYVEALREENEIWSTRFKNSEDQLRSLQPKYNRVNSENAQLRAQLKGFDQKKRHANDTKVIFQDKKKLSEEKEKLLKEKTSLESKNQQMNDYIKKLTGEKSVIMEAQHETDKSYKAALEQQGIAEAKVQKLLQELKGLKEDKYRLDNQIGHLNNEAKRGEETMAKLRKENAKITEDKNNALRRLSEVLGDRMKFNNPRIADLSDGNRPFKLEERFSELYDNEWTDAYDVLSAKEVNDIEQILLDIVMLTFIWCSEISDKQRRLCEESFKMPMDEELPDEIGNSIVDFRKKMSNKILQNVHKALLVHVKSEASKCQWVVLLDEPKMRKYIEICCEITWLMSVQSPPVHLSCEGQPGETFNKDLYREYTQSGPYLQQIVWPMVFLHKGGPMMRKGVANGCHRPVSNIKVSELMGTPV